MIIFLIGYMGSGKSTVGEKLATALNYKYIDLDDFLQIKEELAIKELFDTKGEIYFRKSENKHLQELLQLESTVVSLGGGTPCYGNNMDSINSTANAKSVYLKASIPTLVDRLKTEKNERPLISHLQSDAGMTEFIGKHLFERSFFYNQAHLTIAVDEKSIDTIVDEIMLKLF